MQFFTSLNLPMVTLISSVIHVRAGAGLPSFEPGWRSDWREEEEEEDEWNGTGAKRQLNSEERRKDELSRQANNVGKMKPSDIGGNREAGRGDESS